MDTLTVYLADLPGKIEWPAPIRRILEDHFNKVAAQSGKFSANVVYTSQAPKAGDHDLLVYFVNDPADSVIKALGGTPNSNGTGWTTWNHSETASEVYLSGVQDDPVGIGKLAFHELMHYKSHLNDTQLHTMKQLSLGREVVTADTPLNDEDIAFMVKYLDTKRKAWTGGFTYYHDPLR